MELLLLAALVAGLALAWWVVRERRREPAPAELPDPHDVMIERVEKLAEESRAAGGHAAAQRLSLKAAWLRTKPRLGDDEPPRELDPNDERHLRLVNEVWGAYARLLADDTGPYAGCAYKPESMLEHPKEYIARALGLLVDMGEGRLRSVHVDTKTIPPDAVQSLREALQRLEGFLDMSAEDLPQDPAENARVGRGRAPSA